MFLLGEVFGGRFSYCLVVGPFPFEIWDWLFLLRADKLLRNRLVIHYLF